LTTETQYPVKSTGAIALGDWAFCPCANAAGELRINNVVTPTAKHPLNVLLSPRFMYRFLAALLPGQKARVAFLSEKVRNNRRDLEEVL
jgi:hypothetical protein